MEAGVAEGEHAAVGGHQPVAVARWGGGHAHHGPVEPEGPGGAPEGGVAEGEHAAVGGHQPVAGPPARHRRHPDDGLVQTQATGGPDEGGTEGEHAAVGGNQPIARALDGGDRGRRRVGELRGARDGRDPAGRGDGDGNGADGLGRGHGGEPRRGLHRVAHRGHRAEAHGGGAGEAGAGDGDGDVAGRRPAGRGDGGDLGDGRVHLGRAQSLGGIVLAPGHQHPPAPLTAQRRGPEGQHGGRRSLPGHGHGPPRSPLVLLGVVDLGRGGDRHVQADTPLELNVARRQPAGHQHLAAWHRDGAGEGARGAHGGGRRPRAARGVVGLDGGHDAVPGAAGGATGHEHAVVGQGGRAVAPTLHLGGRGRPPGAANGIEQLGLPQLADGIVRALRGELIDRAAVPTHHQHLAARELVGGVLHRGEAPGARGRPRPRDWVEHLGGEGHLEGAAGLERVDEAADHEDAAVVEGGGRVAGTGHVHGDGNGRPRARCRVVQLGRGQWPVAVRAHRSPRHQHLAIAQQGGAVVGAGGIHWRGGRPRARGRVEQVGRVPHLVVERQPAGDQHLARGQEGGGVAGAALEEEGRHGVPPAGPAVHRQGGRGAVVGRRRVGAAGHLRGRGQEPLGRREQEERGAGRGARRQAVQRAGEGPGGDGAEALAGLGREHEGTGRVGAREADVVGVAGPEVGDGDGDGELLARRHRVRRGGDGDSQIGHPGVGAHVGHLVAGQSESPLLDAGHQRPALLDLHPGGAVDVGAEVGDHDAVVAEGGVGLAGGVVADEGEVAVRVVRVVGGVAGDEQVAGVVHGGRRGHTGPAHPGHLLAVAVEPGVEAAVVLVAGEGEVDRPGRGDGLPGGHHLAALEGERLGPGPDPDRRGERAVAAGAEAGVGGAVGVVAAQGERFFEGARVEGGAGGHDGVAVEDEVGQDVGGVGRVDGGLRRDGRQRGRDDEVGGEEAVTAAEARVQRAGGGVAGQQEVARPGGRARSLCPHHDLVVLEHDRHRRLALTGDVGDDDAAVAEGRVEVPVGLETGQEQIAEPDAADHHDSLIGEHGNVLDELALPGGASVGGAEVDGGDAVAAAEAGVEAALAVVAGEDCVARPEPDGRT